MLLARILVATFAAILIRSGCSQPQQPVSPLPTSIPIPVSIDGPLNVKLPEDAVELTAKIENEKSWDNVSLAFLWEVLSGGGLASSKVYTHQNLVLNKLKPGTIVVRVTVSGAGILGKAEHTLTVIEVSKASDPPKAVIRPEGPIESIEGNTLTLDAEGSVTSSAASFEWAQISGPAVTLAATNVPSLKIERLVKGVYKFRMTVTDAEGRKDAATVNVVVREERDDPPKAHITECGIGSATATVTVRLPKDQIQLCANTSQDDKGVTSFRWYRVDDFAQQLTVDVEGSTSDVLVLKNLQPTETIGAYEFSLDVADVKGQKDTARVSIFVHAAHNMAPVPNGGGNRTVTLPETSLVLEGNAKDDGEIKAFNWTQISGPNNASLVNANQAKATVSGLLEGEYSFRFAVVDDGGLEASDVVWVTVARGENNPPVAVADNVTVALPVSIVRLDGSRSHDDAGIVKYIWTPDDDVPSAIQLLGDSARSSVLLVGRLIAGTFKFNFTVRDQQGASDERWVWLHVEKGEAEEESVELLIQQSISQFSFLLKEKLENRISAILSTGLSGVSGVNVNTVSVDEEPGSGMIRYIFWAESREQTDEMRRRRGSRSTTQAQILKADLIVEVLRAETTMQDSFFIKSIEPKYCHLDCSGHGQCSDQTKECVCERFWMASLIGIILSGGKHYDCGWSSVYFWIGTFVFLLSVFYYVFVRKSSRSSWSKKAKRLRSPPRCPSPAPPFAALLGLVALRGRRSPTTPRAGQLATAGPQRRRVEAAHMNSVE
ncbi:unnamed protein product, partial [Mesorhabditis spiculigera]